MKSNSRCTVLILVCVFLLLVATGGCGENEEITVTVTNSDTQVGLVVVLTSGQSSRTIDFPPELVERFTSMPVTVGSNVAVTSRVGGVLQATKGCSVDRETINGGFGQGLIETGAIICSTGFANTE